MSKLNQENNTGTNNNTSNNINPKLAESPATNGKNMPQINNIQTSKDSFLADAYQLSQEGFWSFHLEEKRFEFTNEALSILELPGDTDCSNIKTITDLLPPPELSKLHALVNQISKNVNSFDFALRFVLNDGSNKYVAVKSKLKRDIELNPLQLFGTFRDITEEHYQNQRLRESEELFKSLFNNLTDIFIIFELERDENNNVTDYIYKDVNPVFEMKFDTSKTEIINKKLSQQNQLFQQFHPILKITAITREPQQNSFFIQSLDSFVEVLIYSPSENLLATIWRDVSLMVEANSSLRESEEKYRQIFSIGKDGLFMHDFLSGKIIDVNPAGCEMFGFSKEQLMKMLFKELYTEVDKIEKKILEKKPTSINAIGINQNGHEFPVEASLSYFNWSGRKVVVASVRNTSERVLAQKELVKSEKKFKQLFDFSNDAILIIKEFKIVEFNQKSQQIFEIPTVDFSNTTLWNLSPIMQPGGENSRTKILELIQQASQGNQIDIEWVFEKPNKSIFYADVKLSPIFFENEKLIQVIVRDISPRKIAEEELKLKENRWKQSLEISSTGVWEWNIITNEVYFSQVWKSIVGYEKDEVPNHFDEYEKRIHPDDVEYVYSSFESYFAAKVAAFSIEFRFRCKNGTYKWINSRGKIYSYTPEGKPERFVGTHTDITRFKINIKKQEEIQEKYLRAAKISNLGFWELNLKNMIINAPEDTFLIFGLKSTTQVSLKHVELLIHPEDQKKFMGQFTNVNEENDRSTVFRIILENQTKFIASVVTPLTDAKNTLIGFEGIFQDITAYKHKEQKLKDDQKLIQTYLNKTNQAIITFQDDQIVFMNNRFSEITGFKADELYNKQFKLIDLIVPEDKPAAQKYFEHITDNKNNGSKVTFRFESKSGRIKWLELTSSLSEFKGREAILYIFEDITERKIKEQNQFAELHYKNATVSSVLIGISFVDLNEKITFANHEFFKITGLNELQIKQQTLSNLFKPSDYSGLMSAIEELKNGEITEHHTELQLPNNNWISLRITPSLSEKNELTGITLFLENISQHRKQNELLSEENLINKAILNELFIGVGVFDNSYKLIQYNQKLFQLFEIDNNHELITINDFVNFGTEHTSLFEQVKFHHQTQKYTFKTVQLKTISVELIKIEMEYSSGVLLQAIDITEQINKTKHLSSQLERFESMFDQNPLGVAMIDKNRNIVICNQKYASTLKYEISELNHQRLDQLIQTENLSELITNSAELFANVIPSFSHTIQVADKTGSLHWINSTLAPIFDKFNEISYALQIITDVSYLKESENTLISNERLNTLNYLANSFAHQFNNQLMAMYGNSYLLKSNLTDPAMLKYAEALFQSINKASDITNNLLSFSKSSHQLRVIVPLNQLFNDLTSHLDLPPNLALKTVFDTKCKMVLGDSAMLQRAIQNIIENAIEAMPTGGEIVVETKSVYFEEKPENFSTLPDKGRYIRIRISDTGKGIAHSEISKIFEPFYTTKTNIQSSGLGLTIAMKTVQDHGGTINVKSNNLGTDMMIYLPQPDEDLINMSIQPDEQLIFKGSANLMIIDDEDVVRIVTGELLKKLGYNIFSFGSGNRAIKFYKENTENIDLVVLDKHMPEMDGKVVFSKLKETNPNVKVILLTGFNIDAELQNFFENENCQIIQKPVSIEKLSKAISSLLFS